MLGLALVAAPSAFAHPMGAPGAWRSGLQAAPVPPRCCVLESGLGLSSGLVWRGQRLIGAPNLQPWLSAEWGGAYLEVAGSWALDESWSEQDVSVGYARPLSHWRLALLLNGYAFPDSELSAGSPVVEAGVELDGPPALPFYLLAVQNLAHDPERAAYGEAGVTPSWGDNEVSVFVGAALSRSEYYAARAGEVVSLGLSAGRVVRRASGASLHVGAAFVYNPADARGWLMAHLGIRVPLGGAAGGGVSTHLSYTDRRPQWMQRD